MIESKFSFRHQGGPPSAARHARRAASRPGMRLSGRSRPAPPARSHSRERSLLARGGPDADSGQRDVTSKEEAQRIVPVPSANRGKGRSASEMIISLRNPGGQTRKPELDSRAKPSLPHRQRPCQHRRSSLAS